MKNGDRKLTSISVVAPVYNEEHGVGHFIETVRDVLSPMTREFEIILVDDGSRDGSERVIREYHDADGRVRMVRLSRNFGRETALTAGLDFASADVVVVMDSDMQDPPELIPVLVERWREGNDVVYARRAGREGESIFKKVSAKVFYRLIDRLSELDLPVDVSDFRLMDRKAVGAVRLMREKNRYMKGIYSWVGFKQAFVSFRRKGRQSGSSSYGLGKMMSHAMDGFTGFGGRLLYLPVLAGVALMLLCCLLALFWIISPRLSAHLADGRLLLLAIIFAGALQLLTLGLVGQFIDRTLKEARNRPLYIVGELVGIKDPGSAEPR